MDRPNIYNYLHYREYLKDMYHYLKVFTNGRYSFRVFARKARMGSPNYLKMVIDGNRELSAGTITKFGRALDLKKHEIQFLEALVYYSKGKTPEEKEFHLQKIKKYKKFKIPKNITADQHNLFSRWYVPVVREMVLLKDFEESPQWIARKIKPSISVREAREALEILLHLGFLVRGDQGKLKQNTPVIATDVEENSETLWNFHRKMIMMSAEALKVPASERNISGMTMAMSMNQFGELKKMIQAFFAQMDDLLSEQKEPPEMICQVNFQQFSMTRK